MHIHTWTLSAPVHLCAHAINICVRAVQTHSKSCLLYENDLCRAAYQPTIAETANHILLILH